jgi:starch-binding outer membrane protein, SusD/RagB family
MFLVMLALSGILAGCNKDFLTVNPRGNLNEVVLANEEGINSLLIGAYSMLDGVSAQFGWESASSNWLYGDIYGMIANIGSDAGAQSDISEYAEYAVSPKNSFLSVKWREVYEAISRCNNVILVTNLASGKGSITKDQENLFLKQARVLRGWYHFEAWRMWEKVPYVDEKADQNKLTNTEDIRDNIIADLTEGTSLPNNMEQVGRFNGTVSKILLAKALMQMKHDYAGALLLLQDAKNGTKPNGDAIGLASTYGEVFDIVNRNGIESVYTVQYSVNDGSGGYNGGYGEVLNFPYKTGGSPGGCCGVYAPTQEFVN